METQAPEAEPPMPEMPEMERQDPAPEPEPQPRMPEMERRDPAPEPEQDPAPEPEPQPMPEMEPLDPATEPEPQPQDPAPEPEPQQQDPAPEPQPRMPEMEPEDRVRFGGPIYIRTRRGQKRAMAETVSESPSPLRPRTDHLAPSPLPSPLRPDPGSSSSDPQALDEFMERLRIQDQKMALLFLEDLLKELKRAGLSRFVTEEHTYRSNADSIFSLLETLRFEGLEGGFDLKTNLEVIFYLFSQYTEILSFNCEQIFMEANKDDLLRLRADLGSERGLLQTMQNSQDEDKETFEAIRNSLSLENIKAKKLEEEVAKIAQQINHLKSEINIFKDALGAAECELNAAATNEYLIRYLRERMFFKKKADTNVKLDGLAASIPS